MRYAPSTMTLLQYSHAVNASVEFRRNPRAELLAALQLPPNILTRRQSVQDLRAPPTINAPQPIDATIALQPQPRQRRMSAPELSAPELSVQQASTARNAYNRADILRALDMPNLLNIDSDSSSQYTILKYTKQY